MKILMVSSFLPYPLINGGNIRLYNLLKNLSKDFEVTLVCEKRNFQTQKDLNEVKKFCKKIITVDRKKQWSFLNALKTLFSTSPFLLVGHTLPEMKAKIRKELEREEYDLIHIETFYIMQNLPKTSLPVVLVEHNIEYLVYNRYADYAPFFLKPFLKWDIAKLKNKEETSWKKARILVAVSEKEKKIMNADAIVLNGVDIEKFKVQSSKFKVQKEGKRVLFIGDLSWVQNRVALKWLLKQIWPKIKVDAKLWIVSRKIPSSIKRLSKNFNVIFEENSSLETGSIFQRATILLFPNKASGGSSFKVLEAMSCGVPVVTSRLTLEGISATPGKDIIICESAEEFSQAIEKLLKNEILYQKLVRNARLLIEEKYDWKKITRKLEKVYRIAVKND